MAAVRASGSSAQPRQQIAGKPCLAAEKMRDARDVEDETIGGMRAHQRRVASSRVQRAA
jgi:hypothetical protein